VIAGGMDLLRPAVSGTIGGMIGIWNGPVAETTRRASMTPFEVSTRKPGLPFNAETEVTSTPVRIGASNFFA